MFPVSIAMLIGGYAIVYYGLKNLQNGGKGPSFSETLGLKGSIGATSVVDNQPANLVGQPATVASPPPGGVWT